MSDTNTNTNPQSAIAGGLDNIALPHDVVKMLHREARLSRKSVTEAIRQWLQDQADGREAAKVLKRIQEGKEKLHPAKEVYARLGL
jgi:predicted DNA-binding protein